MQSIQSIGLTGIILIDIAIGVIFAILTFALISSALYEAISGVFNFRGSHLRKGIVRLLGSEELQNRVLNHQLIESLRGPRTSVERMVSVDKSDERMPSSIPKATFAKALIESLLQRREDFLDDVERTDSAIEMAINDVGQEIDQLAIGERLKARLKDIVKSVDLAKDDLEAQFERIEDKLRKAEGDIAEWFDKSMDRVTGWYVRRTKTMLFFLGFAMAAGVNFDVIGYGQELARNDAFRNSIVAQAQVVAAEGPEKAVELLAAQKASSQVSAAKGADGGIDPAGVDALIATLEQVLNTAQAGNAQIVKLADSNTSIIGWESTDLQLSDWLRMLASWLVIALGCTLGGQFWFDLLKNFIKVRAGASGLDTDSEKGAPANNAS